MENITVLASGSAGCRILGALKGLPGAEHLKLCAIDSDEEAVELSGVPAEQRIAAGFKWRGGKGCGGNVDNGKSAAAAERPWLEHTLEGCDLLIVAAGLGGGFGSGSLSVIQSVAARQKVPTVFFLATPFSFEGPTRRRVAEKTISEDLQNMAGAVVEIPNDLLFCTLDSTVSQGEAYRRADKEFASAILALALMLTSGNRLSADFTALSNLLKARRSLCTLGFASCKSDEERKDKVLVERLLESPLLGGSTQLRNADSVMLMLNGGRTLSIGDARAILENAERYISPNAELLVGAGELSEWGDEMHLAALAVHFSEKTSLGETPARSEKKSSRRRQSEAPHDEHPGLFDEIPEISVGLMERTTPVIINEVNYDIPTYYRLQYAIEQDCRQEK